MSDSSQGPGWWIASDGKWYPPEQAPGAQPVAEAAVPPATQVPPPIPPPIPPAEGAAPAPTTPTAKSSGGKGCLYALIAVAVLVVLGIGALVAGGLFLGKKVADNADKIIGSTDCSLITADDASNVLGGTYTVYQFGALNSVVAPVFDGRVLGDPDVACFVSSDSGGNTVYIAQTTSDNASSTFAAAKAAAKGTSQDQGNGLSVETLGYFNKDVSGLGDEAFCTTADLTGSSGVLVRKGGKLVYVAVSGFSDNEEAPIIDDDAHCELATKVARKVIG